MAVILKITKPNYYIAFFDFIRYNDNTNYTLKEAIKLEDKTVRHKMYDKSYTYSYRKCLSNEIPLGNHMHIYYEIINLIDGKILYNVEGTEYEMNAGDIIITNPYEFHFITFPKVTVYERQFLQVDKNLLTKYKSDIFDVFDSRKFGENNKIPAKAVEEYGIGKLFEGIWEYTKEPNSDTDFMVSLYSAQIIVKISEILKREYAINTSYQKNPRVRDIQNFIEDNYADKINVEDIAKSVYLNKSYISRLFKQEVGIPILTYLNIRRITLAKNLILNGENVTDIYDRCGFSDYVTFYRAFKKYVGKTPNEFKTEDKNR